jgi:hypothetical protein
MAVSKLIPKEPQEDFSFVSEVIINPYGRKLFIATPQTTEQINSMEEKWALIDEDDQLCGFYQIQDEGWQSYLIIFNMSHKQTISFGMISHESQHVVDYLLKAIGHDYDSENNETATYLIEWIVNQVFKHFIEKGLFDKLSTQSTIK